MGSFYSNKMNKVVEYESLNECILYFLMELDLEVIRYYVQPVEIEIPYFDENFNKRFWKHVPEVLAFRNGSTPQLFQVKEPDNEDSQKKESKKEIIINKYTNIFALEKGWHYKVVIPKALPTIVITNMYSIKSS